MYSQKAIKADITGITAQEVFFYGWRKRSGI